MSLILPDYTFRDPQLLEIALTHRSAARVNNERLEFLGDSILGFVITEDLYQRFPAMSEGELTRLRASLVKKETLAELGRLLRLGDHIRLGPGERKSGGWRRDSILANTVESIIGAIYLDAGIGHARDFILGIYRERLEELDAGAIGKDPKTVLQEYLQARQLPLPRYEVIAEHGEAHKRVFTVRCDLEGGGHTATAEGRSKRIAEQSAAGRVLEILLENKP